MSPGMLNALSRRVCRHECCKHEHIHPPHRVRVKKDKEPLSQKDPWLLPAPTALGESIERAVTEYTPKNFAMLRDDVENDFGSLGPTPKSADRRLHRHLSTMVKLGRVLRVDVGGRLFAYLKPTSRIAMDIPRLRDSLKEMIAYQGWHDRCSV
jgi:hypothetical protein